MAPTATADSARVQWEPVIDLWPQALRILAEAFEIDAGASADGVDEQFRTRAKEQARCVVEACGAALGTLDAPDGERLIEAFPLERTVNTWLAEYCVSRSGGIEEGSAASFPDPSAWILKRVTPLEAVSSGEPVLTGLPRSIYRQAPFRILLRSYAILYEVRAEIRAQLQSAGSRPLPLLLGAIASSLPIPPGVRPHLFQPSADPAPKWLISGCGWLDAEILVNQALTTLTERMAKRGTTLTWRGGRRPNLGAHRRVIVGALSAVRGAVTPIVSDILARVEASRRAGAEVRHGPWLPDSFSLFVRTLRDDPLVQR